MTPESETPTAPDASIRAVASDESPVSRRVDVHVDAKRVRKAFDRAYRDLARNTQIKGFRRGKVPRKVLERVYGASLGEEMQRTLVRETLADAIEQTGLEPLSPPSVDSEPPIADEDFRYTAHVEVRPEIELPELTGLPATRPSVAVSDEDVARELERLRERNAPVVEEPRDTEVETGHVLSIDFVGRIDGEAFEGGTGRDVELEVGSGRFLPGFEEQLVGARADDDREVRVAFPDDYGNAELAGREAVFQVHVGEVKRRELSELDDEFAKDVGDFETLEDLSSRIRQDLLEMRENAARSELYRSLLDALIERTEFDVPPGLGERQLDRRLQDAARRFQEAGLDDADLEGELARLREQWRPAALREVREQLLLDAVARSQEIAVEDGEVDARLEHMAAERGVSAERFREALGEGVTESLARNQLRDEKVLDFLAAAAKVEETSST
jgi:trigger factor